MAIDVLWDEELEDLAKRAIAVYGEDDVLALTDRTIRALVVDRTETNISALEIKIALKAELRRIVTPH